MASLISQGEAKDTSTPPLSAHKGLVELTCSPHNVLSWFTEQVPSERFFSWLGGGEEFYRGEVRPCNLVSGIAGHMHSQLREHGLLDDVQNFSLDAGTPSFTFDASWLDSLGRYAYLLTMQLFELEGDTVELPDGRTVSCPKGKRWVVGFNHWQITGAPEDSYEFNFVGAQAGIELVCGFLEQKNRDGGDVNFSESEAASSSSSSSSSSEEVARSDFDLVGYMVISPNKLLGVDSYRFSADQKGNMWGNTLSHPPSEAWKNAISGRASRMPVRRIVLLFSCGGDDEIE